MRLLEINATCNWGSTGRIVENICDYAASHGWDCFYAHGARYVNNSKYNTYQVGSKKDNYIHILYSLATGRHGLASKDNTRELIRYIASIRPDIIHLHNIHGYYLNYSILFEYLNSEPIPVVWTLHDCWAFTGHCTHFDHIGCNQWKQECCHCPLKHFDYKSLLFDRSTENFRLKKEVFTKHPNLTIVAVSNWLSQKAKESFLGVYPIRTIYNGVDTSVFKYQSSNIKEKFGIIDKKMLLAVATDWDKNKGLNDYIALSRILPDDYKILMVGVSPKVKKQLPSSIISIERTHDISMLVDLYSAAEMVLNLSYLETFGLTTVEGMACGTPSIVYNKTASPELITPETGIVVEAGNVECVLQSILKISRNGKSYYSKKCINRVLLYFNKSKSYNEYIDIFNEKSNNIRNV